LGRNEHHFYVDERTKRSTWIHPYDDPEFLQSLPDTHPAHPSSAQAQAIRKRTEEEEAMMKKRKGEKDQDHPAKGRNVVSDGSKSGEDEDRNWFQRQKDKLVGTPEERAKAKAERKRVNAERVKQQKVSMLSPCCLRYRLMVGVGS
jgi:hypothetical protein